MYHDAATAYWAVRERDWSYATFEACEIWAWEGARALRDRGDRTAVVLEVVTRLQRTPPELDDPSQFADVVRAMGLLIAQTMIDDDQGNTVAFTDPATWRLDRGVLLELDLAALAQPIDRQAYEISRRVTDTVEGWLKARTRIRVQVLGVLLMASPESLVERLDSLRDLTDDLRELYAALRTARGLPPRWEDGGEVTMGRVKEIIRALIVLTRRNRRELWLHDRAEMRWPVDDVDCVLEWKGREYRVLALDESEEGVGVRTDTILPGLPNEGDRVRIVRNEASVTAHVRNRVEYEQSSDEVRLGLYVPGRRVRKLGLNGS
jgi:hypothetical protein